MQKVFENPSKIEALVKQKYGIPDFLMMENAALALKNLILSLSKTPDSRCVILCGKGNNGGDGYALARLLSGKSNQIIPLVFCLESPTAPEAITQFNMCKKMGIKFISQKSLFDELTKANFIIDCLYGTGFKGELSQKVQKLITAANNSNAIRIACDIPTALAFNANYTVTMGEQKLKLFSDKAKNVTGKILVATLGMDRDLFESIIPETKVPAYLIETQDIKLPARTNKAAHKGTYGHTAVMAGEKSGASILCATSAMDFGSGLTTIIKRPNANLSQFKISPELMISELDKNNEPQLPAKTSCLVFGPGVEEITPQDINLIQSWFENKNTKNPAAVFDAGVFGSTAFATLLTTLNKRADSRIILTPHLLELVRFCKNFKQFENITVQELAENPELKIKIGNKLNGNFPNTTIVIKSANTFIASGGKTYIIQDGVPSLAKGGSGDVLAGMIASLLAQGYSCKDAAITACQAHALKAKRLGEQSWDLSPMRLIRTSL